MYLMLSLVRGGRPPVQEDKVLLGGDIHDLPPHATDETCASATVREVIHTSDKAEVCSDQAGRPFDECAVPQAKQWTVRSLRGPSSVMAHYLSPRLRPRK